MVLQELQVQSPSSSDFASDHLNFSFMTTGIRSGLPASSLARSNLHHSGIRTAILSALWVMLLLYLNLSLVLYRIARPLPNALRDHHPFSLLS